MNVLPYLRLKWNHWRYKRAVRRRKVATRERKRLEQKYDREMSMVETTYELQRLVWIAIKLKVWP